ncbi:MAG: serine/threonine protein kinase, partial [bacterium]
MPLLNPSETIRDTYEIERYLDEGAFAEVYRVRHKFLGRQVMKVFKRTGMNQQELDEMMSEAVLLSRLA